MSTNGPERAMQNAEKSPSALPGPPDYGKYSMRLTGFAGLNMHEVYHWSCEPALRSHVGPRGMYKACLARLADGALLACPCTEERRGGRYIMNVFRSRDEGATWEHVETGGDELLGKEPALVTLRDSGLLLLTSHPHGFRISRSDDGGVNWRTRALDGTLSDTLNWDRNGYRTTRSVLEEPDGGLLMILSKGVFFAEDAPQSQAWLFRSIDGGMTWERQCEISVWDRSEPMFEEASVVRLSEGRLLAASRTSGHYPVAGMAPADFPTEGSQESANHMMTMESTDGGQSWSEPRGMLRRGQVHAHLLLLQDRRILCTYATYHLPFGIFAVLSTDDGQSWDTCHPIQLGIGWDYYVGWPTSVQLGGGDILTIYGVRAYRESDYHMRDQVVQTVRWKLP